MTSNSELLIVYRPDGVDRHCTEEETDRALTAWTALLCWLRGADPDELPESEVIGHVARKAALRMPRFPDYDLHLWLEHAGKLDRLPSGDRPGALALPDLVNVMLASVQLQRTWQQRCWLNRVAIEMLYGRAASFQRHRHMLVPALLDGPVAIERWTGHRVELGLAVKLLVRKVLSATAITNLIHVEVTTAAKAADVVKAVEVPIPH
ncbi:hypothetical protein ALI22I_23200 [Saccharothrix sp. ALI-22-I]|uniref:hypothetical protein n=1 Tax=Saccharothrix sp. ALI-22-I TaxID=1933778 RepID=UPI00097C93E9|nr:hypothetical protein [Saccharothrix sp. ALI-22-I]ONI87332.1 hypothetical protein ALI22I_23200 [Saccharothrix sp. ALI-22-I]